MALDLLLAALKLEPEYPAAQAHAAWCFEQRYHRDGHRPDDKAEAIKLARAVIVSLTDDGLALAIAAFVLAMFTHDYEIALGAVERALAWNGNSALTLGFAAMTEANSGRYEEAIGHAQHAIRLSPLDPMNYHPYLGMGFAYFFSGRCDEAVQAAGLAIRTNPTFLISHAVLVASYVELGQAEKASAAARRLLELAPGFEVSFIEQHEFTFPERVAQFGAALRKGGLPG